MVIVRPDRVVRWHRHGFKAYWRWKSRGYPGRPRMPGDVRDLIHEVSIANPLVGRATHSRRTLEVKDRCGSIDRGEVHGQGPSATAGWCTSPLPPIRRPTGSRIRSPRRFLDIQRPNTSFAIAIAIVSMDRSSGGTSIPWASGADPQHRGRHGKMDILSALSDRSGASAWITYLYLVKRTCASCLPPMPTITTERALACRWEKTRPIPDRFFEKARSDPYLTSVVCTIPTSGSNLR